MRRFCRVLNLAAVGLPALGAGCVAPQQVVNQRDSTGITIVENRSGDHELGWRFALAATIGGANHDVELSELTEYTVDADTLGHIFVMDSWFGTRLQLVDTTGKLLARLTRQGGGPGEIGNGVSVSATADGIVAIMDHSKAGLARIQWDRH